MELGIKVRFVEACCWFIRFHASYSLLGKRQKEKWSQVLGGIPRCNGDYIVYLLPCYPRRGNLTPPIRYT